MLSIKPEFKMVKEIESLHYKLTVCDKDKANN